MSTNQTFQGGLLLAGLDGSNPLAFLAALGTLRSVSLAWPDQQVALAWMRHANAWRPFLQSPVGLTQEAVVSAICGRLAQMKGHPALAFADDLSISPKEFRCHADQCVQKCQQNAYAANQIEAEFAAAFACDALATEKGLVQDTALRTMAGAGHQHFLKTMRNIVDNTKPKDIHKALFDLWKYDDAIAGQSMRWDPADDARYALQWRDPSADPSRQRRGGMLGANCLAIEGLPLMPCAPGASRLQTTGFIGDGAKDTYWYWPIWSYPVSMDVCRSLLAMKSLLPGSVRQNSHLREYGILAVFRSQRITVGKFRNFTPAVAVF